MSIFVLWTAPLFLLGSYNPLLADDAQKIIVPPTNHIEQQQQATACAIHAQTVITHLSTIPEEDTKGFRQMVINALKTLANCREQDAAAMQHRNNAQVEPPAFEMAL